MAESSSKVSFTDDVSWCETKVVQEERNSDFDYVSANSSELGSSDKDGDAEKLEAIFGAVFNTLFSANSVLQPAERQSLLLFNKDLKRRI